MQEEKLTCKASSWCIYGMLDSSLETEILMFFCKLLLICSSVLFIVSSRVGVYSKLDSFPPLTRQIFSLLIFTRVFCVDISTLWRSCYILTCPQAFNDLSQSDVTFTIKPWKQHPTLTLQTCWSRCCMWSPSRVENSTKTQQHFISFLCSCPALSFGCRTFLRKEKTYKDKSITWQT